MRRHLWFVGTLVLICSLSACGLVTPKPTDIQTANFGPRPSRDEALTLIKAHMSKSLFDPYSAVYECDEPRKAWANNLGTIYYGYIVPTNINAKNRLGGYVGSQPCKFMIYSGAIILTSWVSFGYLD